MSSTTAARKRASSRPQPLDAEVVVPDPDLKEIAGEIRSRFVDEKYMWVYALITLVVIIVKLTAKLDHIPEQFIKEQVKNEAESLRELLMMKSAFFEQELKGLGDKLNLLVDDKSSAQLKDTGPTLFSKNKNDAEKEDVIVDKDAARIDYGLASGDARVVSHSEAVTLEPIPESVHSDGYKRDEDVASGRVDKSYFLVD